MYTRGDFKTGQILAFPCLNYCLSEFVCMYSRTKTFFDEKKFIIIMPVAISYDNYWEKLVTIIHA